MSVAVDDSPIVPFPWFGGKSKIAPVVWELFGNADTFVEPFCGSAAVLFKRPNVHQWWNKVETINDADGHLVNTLRAIRDHSGELVELLQDPVNEADLTARHLYLTQRRSEVVDALVSDPHWCDVQQAAWWVWGISQWVGGEWCTGEGSFDGGNPADGAVYRKMPMVAGSHPGRGIHRHPGLRVAATDGAPPPVRSLITEQRRMLLEALADRLARVRITCGDWQRVTKSAMDPARSGGFTAVFLDPPYDPMLRRGGLYAGGDASGSRSGVEGQIGFDVADLGESALPVHDKALQWALHNGSQSNLKIIYCGYADADVSERFAEAGWKEVNWKASGGYGLQSVVNRARGNRDKERVWVSPVCVSAASDFIGQGTLC